MSSLKDCIKAYEALIRLDDPQSGGFCCVIDERLIRYCIGEDSYQDNLLWPFNTFGICLKLHIRHKVPYSEIVYFLKMEMWRFI